MSVQTPNTTIIGKDEHSRVVVPGPGEYIVVLDAPGAEAAISGVFSTAGSDIQNVSIIIHHRAPHTRATTEFRGVARDKSQLRLYGKIVIDEHCPDVQSFLTERILLLSDEAKAEAVPELEILSDDVKCSHAASVSRIPESQLFYLMSRGLSHRQAEEMVVEGFLEI